MARQGVLIALVFKLLAARGGGTDERPYGGVCTQESDGLPHNPRHNSRSRRAFRARMNKPRALSTISHYRA